MVRLTGRYLDKDFVDDKALMRVDGSFYRASKVEVAGQNARALL